MAKALVAMIVSVSMLGLAAAAMAQSKKCPDGMKYDPQTNKCYKPPRGSY